jgi:HlyD family secretion protein
MELPWIGKVENRLVYSTIGLLAVASISLTGIAYGLQQRNRQGELDQLTVPVVAEDVNLRIRGSGTIQPIRTVNVSPKTAGRVVEVLVDQGDRVTEGQLLARMEDQDLRAELDQAQANLAAAEARLETLVGPTRNEAIGQAEAGVDQANATVTQAEIERARATADVTRSESEVIRAEGIVADAQGKLVLASKQLERQRNLASQGAISQNSLDEFIQREDSARQAVNQANAQLKQARIQVSQSQRQVDQADARVDQVKAQRSSAAAQRQQQGQFGSPGEIRQAEAQVAASRAQLAAVQNRVNDTEIRAPFDGLVTQRYASAGAFVTPTTQASAVGSGATNTSIFAVANGLEVLAKVPEVDIARISKGQKVGIRVDAFPEDDFEGKVRLIAPEAVVEQNVTYFQVRVDPVTGLDKLKSGMNVDLEFTGDKLNATKLVPTVAIVTKRGKPGVLVPGKDKKPEFKPVEIGSSFKDKTQVLSGLEVGDKVFKELPAGLKLDKILNPEEDKK